MSPAYTRSARRRASSCGNATEKLAQSSADAESHIEQVMDVVTMSRSYEIEIEEHEAWTRSEDRNNKLNHQEAMEDEEIRDDEHNSPEEEHSLRRSQNGRHFSKSAQRTLGSAKSEWRKFFPDDSSDESEDDNLNIDKIEDLLYLAECRLREREKTLESFRFASPSTEPNTKLAANIVLPKSYARSNDRIVRPEASALLSDEVRALAKHGRPVDEVSSVKRKDKKQGLPPGLATHFDLPRTKVTPELKRDLQLLSMRAVLDPKRMYKRQGKFKIPEHSQIGTIVEGPTDFYSGRINKKEREISFVKETIKAEQQTGRFKRKYADLQVKQRSGKKSFWNARMAKRKRH